MCKLTGEEIIEIIIESRRTDYYYEECWTDLADIGLSLEYTTRLGELSLVKRQPLESWVDEVEVVWYFKNHDVYIQGKVSSGSYGTGYKLDTWELKQVFPKKIEVIIYE